MSNTKFVFWRCDSFPYVLGAPADPRPNGMWYVTSYQMTVKADMVYEIEAGQHIAYQIRKLREERNAAQRALEVGFDARLAQIASFALTRAKRPS